MQQKPVFKIEFIENNISISMLNNLAKEVYIVWEKYSGQTDSNILFLAFLLSCSNTKKQIFNKNKIVMKLNILNTEFGEIANCIKLATNFEN